jgi:two-component system OmpR family response regulator
VDDDEVVTQQFAGMLRLEGYQVRTALDAATGLREATAGRLDAVILDLRMPIGDGLALLRRLRALDTHRDTPVTMVTGDYFIGEMMCAELQALGADLRFKPLWLEDLLAIVDAMVSRAASMHDPDSPSG